jgi:hypothetical protein
MLLLPQAGGVQAVARTPWGNLTKLVRRCDYFV